ncbi:Uncharacterized protein SCF082_LOCUS14907 [Durusdinium trenchii]|uniref:Uncharacterized protein n=1 Tax=Durusdinium trenchii TaxID=1381693 RepID=A0ABP0K2F8_9DINO
MGPALGVLAAEEIIAIAIGTVVIGGGTAYLAAHAFEHAVQNCPCGPAPDIPQDQNIPDQVMTFKIKSQTDISSLTLVSAVLRGTTITNQKVPFTYSFLIGKGEADGQHLYHAGILIEGDFDAEGRKFGFLFAERWADSVRVNLFKSKRQALMLLRSINANTVDSTDCNETPSFTSLTTANAMVEFIHEEFSRKLDLRSFKTPEDLKKMRFTNCIVFALRAGILLGQDERDHFLATCMTAIGE